MVRIFHHSSGNDQSESSGLGEPRKSVVPKGQLFQERFMTVAIFDVRSASPSDATGWAFRPF